MSQEALATHASPTKTPSASLAEAKAAYTKQARKPPPPLDTAIAYTVPNAASVVGLSRATLFKMIKVGKLPSVFVAGRRLIPTGALRQLIDDAT